MGPGRGCLHRSLQGGPSVWARGPADFSTSPLALGAARRSLRVAGLPLPQAFLFFFSKLGWRVGASCAFSRAQAIFAPVSSAALQSGPASEALGRRPSPIARRRRRHIGIPSPRTRAQSLPPIVVGSSALPPPPPPPSLSILVPLPQRCCPSPFPASPSAQPPPRASSPPRLASAPSATPPPRRSRTPSQRSSLPSRSSSRSSRPSTASRSSAKSSSSTSSAACAASSHALGGSVLDSETGITFHGKSIPDSQKVLPTAADLGLNGNEIRE